jgi:hypothetical protein
MKTNKEYPATHSMSTAWYCVDEDGNVGIFDIEDNGPVPVGEYVQNDVEEVFWDDFSIDNGEYIKDLMLKPEQIPPLIERLGNYGTWESGNCDWSNADWMYTILKIDMSKLDILKQALSKDRYHDQRPVCISKEQGLFYVDFFYNKEGVELLLENNVILAKYKVPHYSTQWSKDREEEGARQRNAFPLFIYHQDYVLNDLPAMRLTNPPSPLKIEQLPKEIQAKIHKLPLKFKETERIQLAELMPVEHIWSMDYVYDGKIWWELASSDDSLIYYNEESNTIITKERMDILIANGEAEEFNWDKHRHMKEER